ncbi:hypothetical protein CCM_00157 [Cordyceps militaris CM01]|uniref:Uncharacterized protein n=1 Tax=Cordyceps militaris (strain CM01) TaxID=983644 RepID=G3J7N7_CORMM|nr:uncharacterized protein CCM_00157 [Cordyceps militaris CM01]EGX95503.1 hypothetical protein CCM_00157 [Cordyceps militaris CM01]
MPLYKKPDCNFSLFPHSSSTLPLHDDARVGGDTGPQLRGLLADGAGDGGALHLALGVDDDAGIVLKVEEDTVEALPGLGLADNDGGVDLLAELGLALLDGRDNHVADAAGGQTVQAGTDTLDGDDVEVAGTRVVGAVHDGTAASCVLAHCGLYFALCAWRRGRRRGVGGNVHRETQGHLELATGGTTAARSLLVLLDRRYEVLRRRAALLARLLRYDVGGNWFETNGDANSIRRRKTTSGNSIAATQCIRRPVFHGCSHIRAQVVIFADPAHSSSYPANLKMSPAACRPDLLLLHIVCFAFACIVEAESSRGSRENLRDLGHCEGLCVALIREGETAVSGIAVVIESFQGHSGENFLWGEKPYVEASELARDDKPLIQPCVGRL